MLHKMLRNSNVHCNTKYSKILMFVQSAMSLFMRA